MQLILDTNGEILNKVDEWMQEGSNFRIEKILKHYVNGWSYIKLPKEPQRWVFQMVSCQIT